MSSAKEDNQPSAESKVKSLFLTLLGTGMLIAGGVRVAMMSDGGASIAGNSGFPCVDELCIGDEVGKLGAIEWVAEYDESIPEGWRQSLDLDGRAIERLVIYPIMCRRDRPLDGVFRSKSGYPTRVKVDLMVNGSDVTQQRWIVSSIERVYAHLPRADMLQVHQELIRKYAPFIMSYEDAQEWLATSALRNHGHVPPLADVSLGPSLAMPESVTLLLRGEEIGTWHPADHERHPDCGGRGNAPLTTE